MYGAQTIPRLFIIGRDRKILALTPGYGDRSPEKLVTEINAAELETRLSAAD